MGLVYNNSVPGVGKVLQSATPISVISGIFLTTPEFEFATKAAFATEATWLAGIAAGNIFPISEILESDVKTAEDKVTTTTTGKKVFQFEMPRDWELKTILSLEQHKKLRQYSFKNWRVLIVDANGNILAVDKDGTKVHGFALSYFRVPKMGDPSVDGAFSKIHMQLSHVDEWDKKGLLVNPEWLASDMVGVLDVTITAGVVAANSCTVTAAYIDDSQLLPTGASNSTPLSGLVAANFLIMHGAAEVTVGKTVTESSTILGTYTVAATSLVATDTIKLVASSTMLYKSDAIVLSA